MLEQLQQQSTYATYPFRKVLMPLGVTYVEPYEQLRKTADAHKLYLKDRHPAAKGNRRVADVIRSHWPK
jgi:hypothetical protein